MLPGKPFCLPGVLLCLPAVVFLAASADDDAVALVFTGNQLPGNEVCKCERLLPGNGQDGYASAYGDPSNLSFSYATDRLQDPSDKQPDR